MSFSKDPMILRTIIMEHFEHPTHKTDANTDARFVHHQNKSTTCIDDITAHLAFGSDGRIIAAQFSGMGCAISTASTDMIAGMLVGKTRPEAREIIDNYLRMLSQQPYEEEQLDELIALYNIPNQPNRLKCAQIGINAFKYLLEDEHGRSDH